MTLRDLEEEEDEDKVMQLGKIVQNIKWPAIGCEQTSYPFEINP